MKNKKDCSLVVQLLKCNQSLDRKFVSQKMDMVSKLRKILTRETQYIVSIKLKKYFRVLPRRPCPGTYIIGDLAPWTLMEYGMSYHELRYTRLWELDHF